MNKLICLCSVFISIISLAQQKEGIVWTKGLSWEEIKEKAKADNKFIFLDCFATWCGPCKAMDKSVYVNQKVGDWYNSRFISVKVQIDSTEFDDIEIKSWYSAAKALGHNYSINSFPTFLFFSSNGSALHKETGFKSPEDFIVIAQNALDSQKQFYSVLSNYVPGKLDSSELKKLAVLYKFSGKELAWKLAVEYLKYFPKTQIGNERNIQFLSNFIESPEVQRLVAEYLHAISVDNFRLKNNLIIIQNFKNAPLIQRIILERLKKLNLKKLEENLAVLRIMQKVPDAKIIADYYINSLSEPGIYKKENLLLIGDFMKTSNDRGFNIFLKSGATVNKIVDKKKFSEDAITNVIYTEEYAYYWDRAINTNSDNIPWDSLSKSVKVKYGTNLSDKVDLYLKTRLYEYFATRKNQYWTEYLHYAVLQIKKYGTDTTSFIEDVKLNGVCWDIFRHSANREHISLAIDWMAAVVRRNFDELPTVMDTYANLLYKNGNTSEAVRLQTRLCELDPTSKEFQVNLEKMKRGEPTWPTK